jgi:hypothetical protein
LLTITCPNCNRRAIAPITILNWPGLFGVCPHGNALTECSICQKSKSEKISVLDLDLPRIIEATQKTTPKSDLDILATHHAQIEDDPMEFDEEIALIIEELGDDMENYARSEETGWFYPDDD